MFASKTHGPSISSGLISPNNHSFANHRDERNVLHVQLAVDLPIFRENGVKRRRATRFEAKRALTTTTETKTIIVCSMRIRSGSNRVPFDPEHADVYLEIDVCACLLPKYLVLPFVPFFLLCVSSFHCLESRAPLFEAINRFQTMPSL